jgi:hypothetical protein
MSWWNPLKYTNICVCVCVCVVPDITMQNVLRQVSDKIKNLNNSIKN